MHNIVPRVATIQDISGFGRCSLTVVIPILSCMGAQVCPVPTAILSTHTGGFGKVAFTDFTNSMEAYIEHWKALQLKFDYIYTGYLGNEKQIEMVVEFCRTFKKTEREYIVIDPVMGDDGKLYSSFNKNMQDKMKQLVEEADMITPNLTETMFLTGKDYVVRGFNNQEIKELALNLADMGPKVVVIKGLPDEKGCKANIAYDRRNNKLWKIPYEEIAAHYPGTGDAFTSVLIGALIQGDSLPVAINRAAQFISMAIKVTYGYGTDTKEGIMLEKVLPTLLNKEVSGLFYEIEI